MRRYLLLILPITVVFMHLFYGNKEDYTWQPYNRKLADDRKYEECNKIYTYDGSGDIICCDLPWMCEFFNDEMTCIAEVYSDKTAYLRVWWDECVWEISIRRWLVSGSYLVDY